MKILGIDPGLSGCLATYDGTKTRLYPIVSIKQKRGRAIEWDKLCETIRPAMVSMTAYLEQVSTRPGEGRVSAFKFGYVSGGLRGILAYARVPTVMVTPQKWKKHFGLSADKRQAVELACEKFPDVKEKFYGPRGGLRDGLAEAALIALYGYEMEIENV